MCQCDSGFGGTGIAHFSWFPGINLALSAVNTLSIGLSLDFGCSLIQVATGLPFLTKLQGIRVSSQLEAGDL